MTLEGVRLFENDGHVVYWGDALRVLEQRIAESSVDLIFADPPYGIGKQFGSFRDQWPTDAHYVEWCENWLRQCLFKIEAKWQPLFDGQYAVHAASGSFSPRPHPYLIPNHLVL